MPDPDKTLPFPGAGATAAPASRSAVSEQDLLKLLTTHFQANEKTRAVRVVRITRLDAPDSQGCNWSSSLVLDAPGVAPEVYALVYADVVKRARARYTLA